MNIDNLIVGAGLNGSILAITEFLAGRTLRVLDPKHKASNTLLFPQVIEPVFSNIGKSPSFNIFKEEWIKKLNPIETHFNESYLTHKEIVYINSKSVPAEYIKKNIPELSNILNITGPFSTFPNATIIDSTTLIRNVKKELISHKNFILKKLEYKDLKITESRIQWKSAHAQAIHFVHGEKNTTNPHINLVKDYFPVKISTIEWDDFPRQYLVILNDDTLIIPHKNILYLLEHQDSFVYEDQIVRLDSINIRIPNPLNALSEVHTLVRKTNTGQDLHD